MYLPKNFSDIAEPLSELSAREQQVVTLVCDGISNQEIADKLEVTEGTVKGHLISRSLLWVPMGGPTSTT
jgi:ATP/maltotriose-dependent transcriptional regulator MalT